MTALAKRLHPVELAVPVADVAYVEALAGYYELVLGLWLSIAVARA